MPKRDYRSSIDNLRERVTRSDEIDEGDAKFLLAFSDRLDLLQSRIGDYRHKDLLG